MLLDLVQTVAPAGPVVDVADAKQHLRVDHADDDALIEALVQAATDELDGYAGILGRCLAPQTWALHLTEFPCRRFLWSHPRHAATAHHRRHPARLDLPLAPLLTVVSIAYVDPAGVEQALAQDVDFVVLDGPLSAIEPAYGQGWPATRCQSRAVTITFTAGYATVPSALVAAIKMMVADLYENREADLDAAAKVSAVTNPTVARLTRPFVRAKV